MDKAMRKYIFILFSFLIAFSWSCAEKRTTLVIQDNRPPGLTIASEKALENGKKQLRKGHCKQAVHEFNKALEKDPRNFEALYWLGVAEGMCGYYPQSYDRLTVAVRYAPNDLWRARVYATIGITLLYIGRDDDAVMYFEKAKAIDPRNELVIAYYDYEDRGKGHKKHKIKKKPKGGEGFELTLRWLD